MTIYERNWHDLMAFVDEYLEKPFTFVDYSRPGLMLVKSKMEQLETQRYNESLHEAGY
jgi:hypothetical protein